MAYDFLIDTYDTERIKTLSVWSTFEDDDVLKRPAPLTSNDRNVLAHSVHRCFSQSLQNISGDVRHWDLAGDLVQRPPESQDGSRGGMQVS